MYMYVYAFIYILYIYIYIYVCVCVCVCVYYIYIYIYIYTHTFPSHLIGSAYIVNHIQNFDTFEVKYQILCFICVCVSAQELMRQQEKEQLLERGQRLAQEQLSEHVAEVVRAEKAQRRLQAELKRITECLESTQLELQDSR